MHIVGRVPFTRENNLDKILFCSRKQSGVSRSHHDRRPTIHHLTKHRTSSVLIAMRLGYSETMTPSMIRIVNLLVEIHYTSAFPQASVIRYNSSASNTRLHFSQSVNFQQSCSTQIPGMKSNSAVRNTFSSVLYQCANFTSWRR